MANPTIIDIPHELGREEAKRRMRARIGELAGHIPGGMADVASSWPGEDRMALDVQDKAIRVSLMLPPLLGMMAGKITEVVQRKGGALLLGPGA